VFIFYISNIKKRTIAHLGYYLQGFRPRKTNKPQLFLFKIS